MNKKYATLFLGLALVCCAPSVQARTHIYVEEGAEGFIVAPGAPPVPLEETIGITPGVGYVWVPGHWHWKEGEWVWVRGRWVISPYSGAVWEPGYWAWRDGVWVRVRGRWH